MLAELQDPSSNPMPLGLSLVALFFLLQMFDIILVVGDRCLLLESLDRSHHAGKFTNSTFPLLDGGDQVHLKAGRMFHSCTGSFYFDWRCFSLSFMCLWLVRSETNFPKVKCYFPLHDGDGILTMMSFTMLSSMILDK